MNLNEKLNGIQTELKAAKAKDNTFGNYKYRSCEDVLEALKPLLKKFKVVVVINDEIVMVGDRFYIKANVSLKDCESNETVSTSAWAREAESKKGMDESQITGSASSYARKYALSGMFAIDDNKDSDDTNKGQEDEKPVMTPELQQEIHDRNIMIEDIEFAKGPEYLTKLCEAKSFKSVDRMPTDYLKRVWIKFCSVPKETA